MAGTGADGEQTRRRMPPRTRSNFATRTARDDAEQLDRRSSAITSPSPNEQMPLLGHPDQPGQSATALQEGGHERDHGIDAMRVWFSRKFQTSRSKSPKHERKRPSISDVAKPRPGAFPRPVGGTEKLGTFAGVFVPTTLNVLSILMFLRFGFVLGQTGVVGMMGECIPSLP